MRSRRPERRSLAISFCFAVVCAANAGCRSKLAHLEPKNLTQAELRTVRRGVHVTPPGENARAPYWKERLADGAVVTIDPGGLAWVRRDGGATILVAGPAELTLRAGLLDVSSGRLFVDTLSGSVAEVDTPGGPLELSGVRASLDVSKAATSAYVLQGAVKAAGNISAGPGEELRIADGKVAKSAVLSWDDWTGGLATTDRTAEPAPFGVGTVGARPPGATGQARFPLAIQKLEARVTIDHDFAITEVDEVFFNPTEKTVEGIYKFRTPSGATLHRFGVDRDGELVWGRVKEKNAAAAQYQSNVYAGSTEDPALLEWSAPGVYQARLYPIPPGGTRRVVTRYAEWLGRQGEHGERRLYVYPMAAEGAEGSLPRIEELTVSVDLAAAGAKDVRVGMHGEVSGNRLVVRAHDLVPRADLAVELFDDGLPAGSAIGYRARHRLEPELFAPEDIERQGKAAKSEADYVLVPMRPAASNEPSNEAGKGLDVAVVVDTSAATEPSALAIARAATSALLAHLGKEDRVAVWASDARLRPVSDGSGELKAIDEGRRDAILAGLARIDRGGATDLGAVLADASARLDDKRRGIVVYLGDGRPTVGELAVADLRERLSRTPTAARVFAMGIGEDANLGVLKGVARGGFAERVVDGYGAGEAALEILEQAERPVWLGVKADLGMGIDRAYPRELGAVFADETAIVVGRLSGSEPTRVDLQGSGGTEALTVKTISIADDGDLRRRWAEGRLGQLLDEGAGRAAVVEVGVRYGVLTPFTSFYVPTAREAAEEQAKRDQLVTASGETTPETTTDRKESGSGTRAKGEEGWMGHAGASPRSAAAPSPSPPGAAPVAAATAAAAPVAQAAKPAPARAIDQTAQFGVTGALGGDKNDAPAAPWGRQDTSGDMKMRVGGAWGDSVGDSFGGAGLGLSGTGEGGGGRGDGIGLANIGVIGHGAGTGTGQGFGAGHGRLGEHASRPPSLRQGATQVNGRLPPEVIQRIVRQNFGRFRLCYENGLRDNPQLQGRVTVKFTIDRSGAVSTASDGGSDFPNQSVVSCVVRGFGNLSFPQPESGTVDVHFPILFAPAEGSSPAAAATPVADSHAKKAAGLVGFAVRLCDPSADLTLEDRTILWRERLAVAGQGVSAVAHVYDDAVSRCEAPTWTERRRLLSLMLDTLSTVRARVELWRSMFDNAPVADILYRGVLTRVHTTEQLRELHDALGLRRIDPGLLAATLAKEKTAADRAAKLRELVQAWPDDLELALKLLDAYEDAGDAAAERALARDLRRRPDASTKVRTAVGEIYLRLSKTPGGSPNDESEARRTFGEIVEFAPDDPVARRRLGDLLRSHGWFDEAFRQYETLAKLTPDDASVSVLLASAAAGMGKVEEAVGWAEKAGASTAPDGSGLGAVARDWASVILAWARADAKAAGRDKEIVALRERAERVASADKTPGTVRVFMTWTHPELRPVLWSNASGSLTPASRGDPLLGIAVVTLPAGKSGQVVEIHLDGDDAARTLRLRAEITLTAVFDEDAEDEQVTRAPVHLTAATPVLRFQVDHAKLTAVATEGAR